MPRSRVPECRACGGLMESTTISSGNCLGIALALLVFCIGLALCFTGIGALVGIPMMLVALFMGGKKRKVVRCVDCGVTYDRT